AWAQIEKETAAILFGCQKFKHHIYGKRTVVESDCKPVISILKKPLCVAPQRLQKLIMQLQPFDIEVIHKKGSNIPIGDALSRNNVAETYPDMFTKMYAYIHAVKSLPISDERIEQIRIETQNDEHQHIAIDHLPNISSKTVVRKLKVHFSRFGSPVQIKTDNAKNLTSLEDSRNGETYITQSQRREHRRILRFVRISQHSTTMRIFTGAASYVRTPQFTPKPVDIKSARENMQTIREKSKMYYDRNAKPLPTLHPCDRVMFQKSDIWKPTKVVSKYINRSYTIQSADGTNYRRNRKFINKCRTDHLSTTSDQDLPCTSPCLMNHQTLKFHTQTPDSIMSIEKVEKLGRQQCTKIMNGLNKLAV
ncbi:hypothetical protein MAR_012332, partial [Mya arenaria]